MDRRTILITPDLINRLSTIPEDQFPCSRQISLDLSISVQEVILLSSTHLRTAQLETILPVDLIQNKDTRTIFIYDETGWRKWQHFDPVSNRFYKMVYVAPGKSPTVEISGIKMHITQKGDPEQDTLNKLQSLHHLQGLVLDTCTGL
jgi:predicted methyltransferase